MKILVFTKYSRLGASSRQRSFQYELYWKEKGVHITYQSLFDDRYLKRLYQGEQVGFLVFVAYLKRLFSLVKVSRYELVIIEKELFPYLPAWAEYFLKLGKIPFIVDYDDAIFHNYDQHSNYWIRTFLGRKIRQVMRYASRSVVGNAYLADYAQRSDAKAIHIIPTTVPLERYIHSQITPQPNSKFVIGWIGTPSTFQKHYVPCLPWMQELLQHDAELEFRLIGIDPQAISSPLGSGFVFKKWTEASEAEEIAQFDIGIMPLTASPWDQGKCAYKLIQYAAMKIPMLAADVGMNNEVCVDGQSGFLIDSDAEWKTQILNLKNNPVLRKELGEAAFQIVAEKFTTEQGFSLWWDVVSDCWN